MPSLSTLSSFLFGMSKKHNEEHDVINNTLAQVASQQLLNTDHIAQNTEQLKDGRKEFKETRKSIAGLDKSYALLAQKINDG